MSDRLTPHFTRAEFRCKCGKCAGFPPNPATIQKTAEWLEQVREILGGRAIHINSGYRCASHNRAVGGARLSQHVKGTAVDITVAGLSPADVQALLRPHFGAGKLITGLGVYDRWTHIDRRAGAPATWNGS